MAEFMECAACAAKPGSPNLCPSCLNNRWLIGKLEVLLALPAGKANRRVLLRWSNILGVKVRWWHWNGRIRRRCREAIRL